VMNFGLHSKARVEYFKAITYYEERQPGLGALFTIEIETPFSFLTVRVDGGRLKKMFAGVLHIPFECWSSADLINAAGSSKRKRHLREY